METIKFRQPRLLRLGNSNNNNSNTQFYDSVMAGTKQKFNQTMQLKGSNFAHEHNRLNLNEVQQQVIHFHKDPYHFLDVMVEKYFEKYLSRIGPNMNSRMNFAAETQELNKQISQENLKNQVKEEIVRELAEVLSQSKNDFPKQRTEEMLDEIFHKLNLLSNNQPQEKISEFVQVSLQNQLASFDNKVQENESELVSKPVNQNEILKKMMSSEQTQFKSPDLFNKKVNLNGNMIKEVMNNPYSKYYDQNHLTKEVLSCLKGDQILPPNKRFYGVYDITTVPDCELTENLLDMQKRFMKISGTYEQEVLQNAQKSLKNEKAIYHEMLDKTSKNIMEMESKVKDSNQIMSHIYEKLNNNFEKKIIEEGISHLNLVDANLNSMKADILFKEQHIEHQKERLNLNLENTQKLSKTVDRFLSKCAPIKEEANQVQETLACDKSIISDSTLDLLYEQYCRSNQTEGASKTVNPKKSASKPKKSHLNGELKKPKAPQKKVITTATKTSPNFKYS